MTHGERAAAIALSYVGTPFRAGGRVKGVGVDCVGLLICVARDLGAKVPDHPTYSASDALGQLREALAGACDLSEAPSVGDVVVLTGSGLIVHVGIDVGGRLVHAYNAPWAQRVISESIGRWEKRVLARYVFREV